MADYEVLDKQTKEALLKLALGYNYEDKEIIASSSGQAEKIRVIKRHIPPNIKALEEVRFLIKSKKW